MFVLHVFFVQLLKLDKEEPVEQIIERNAY